MFTSGTTSLLTFLPFSLLFMGGALGIQLHMWFLRSVKENKFHVLFSEH